MMNEHLQEFLRIVEEWIQLYYSVEIAGLPGTERRDQLEKIMWQALQEIVEYSKTEEAAKKAEERRQVMELLNHAVKAELAVLHEQDAAYVDNLLREIEAHMKKLKQEEKEDSSTQPCRSSFKLGCHSANSDDRREY
jgi:hypothetical protein